MEFAAACKVHLTSYRSSPGSWALGRNDNLREGYDENSS